MTTEKEPAGDTRPAAGDQSKRLSRRAFVKAAGIGAAVAGAVVAGFSGAIWWKTSQPFTGQPLDPQRFPVPKAVNHPAMQHVVVLMAENRSFDNLLGNLYTPTDVPAGKKFEGLAFGNYSNRAPDGTVIPAHIYDDDSDRVYSEPTPDPGEEYQHVNTQIFGEIIPVTNYGKGAEAMWWPYNLPLGNPTPKMDGFVKDFASKWKDLTGNDATLKDLQVSMGGFSPAQLPVLSTLSKEFGVFDNWFASVPSQTYCNRSFFNAATSHGYVDNQTKGTYNKWFDVAASPTIFNRFEDAGLSWKIYFDALQLISMTGMIHAPALEKYWKTEHFATMADFKQDVANGTLPNYAFVEPRLVFNHNGFHPPVGSVEESDVDGITVSSGGVSDVRAGEALVHEIYRMIRKSDSASGSNSQNTTLIVTFDEAGGTYDHVPPPAAVPPNNLGPGEYGFMFDRLGCRVPAIIVSAHITPGTIYNKPVHPGSFLATLEHQFGLEPLTQRDATAQPWFDIFTASSPRPGSEWPTTFPQDLPLNPEANPPSPLLKNAKNKIPEPGKGLIGLLYAKYGTAAEKKSEPKTYADAYNALVKYGQGLFGVSK